MSRENLVNNVSRRKLIDSCFAIVGLIIIFVAIFILLGLVLQILMEGLPRLTPQFFVSFPSRKAEQAAAQQVLALILDKK